MADGYDEVEVMADKSSREKEKPGAVKTLAELTSNISDDCLIIAGDNLFTASLKGMVETYNRLNAPVIALYDVRNLNLARNYSTVTLDEDWRIIKFVEKPSKPETTLIGTCIDLVLSLISVAYSMESLNKSSINYI